MTTTTGNHMAKPLYWSDLRSCKKCLKYLKWLQIEHQEDLKNNVVQVLCTKVGMRNRLNLSVGENNNEWAIINFKQLLERQKPYHYSECVDYVQSTCSECGSDKSECSGLRLSVETQTDGFETSTGQNVQTQTDSLETVHKCLNHEG